MTDIQTIEPSDIGRKVRSFLGIMNSQELAAALDVKPETLEAWRSKGLGPHFAKLGQAVFYRAEDLVDWIAASIFVPVRKTTAAGAPLVPISGNNQEGAEPIGPDTGPSQGHTTDVVVPEPEDGA